MGFIISLSDSSSPSSADSALLKTDQKCFNLCKSNRQLPTHFFSFDAFLSFFFFFSFFRLRPADDESLLLGTSSESLLAADFFFFFSFLAVFLGEIDKPSHTCH